MMNSESAALSGISCILGCLQEADFGKTRCFFVDLPPSHYVALFVETC